MKLCESCLLLDNVPEDQLARYEADRLSSPRILESEDQFACVRFDNSKYLSNLSTNDFKCSFSLKDRYHDSEILIPLLDLPDETYDEMFVRMLDDCGEEMGVSVGKFTTIAARRELMNECLMKIEQHDLIADKIIINPILESKFKKTLLAQDMDEDYLVVSEYVPEDTFYVLAAPQYLGAIAKKKTGTGISIINHYAVSKAKINNSTLARKKSV